MKKRMTSKGFALGEGGIFEFDGICDCDTPNEELYKFSGSFTHKGKVYVITENQLLLKGSVVRNTEWVRGFVVYTGKYTKLM